MKTDPYWWEFAPREESQPVEVPAQVDIAVTGAGFSGLSAALLLARAGHTVAVFEAGQLGHGASSRNGGMVGPSFHKLGIEGLKAQYGLDKTNAILRESVGFVDFLRDFLTREGIEADFKRTGRFRGALKPAHYDAMARELEGLQRTCGVKGHMVRQQDQACETGSNRFFGGVVTEADGGLNPAKFHDGLIARVRAAGVTILPNTPVQKLEQHKGGYQLTTPRGTVHADRVAICTNGYTGPQFPQLRKRVLPLRSAIIASDPISADLMNRLMPNKRMCGDSRRIVAYYRASPDGTRILFGGRATGIKDNPVKNARYLHSSMVEIFPEMGGVGISHIWSGLVAYTFDHAPHIGQRNGLYYAMGYCGSGVARATYFGHKLAHKILGQEEKGHTAFDDLPFNSKPMYTGNPWFMPAVLNWHRIADKIGL